MTSYPPYKQCKDCEHIKPVEEFYKQRSGSPQPYCKVCKNVRARAYQKGNPRAVAEWGRRSHTKRRCQKYGRTFDPTITLTEVARRDRNICGICGSVVEVDGVVDHIIAIANGGHHIWSNVQLAHDLCNSQKSYRRD